MKNKLSQILLLCGLYFIISSFFGLISNHFNSLFAIIFPVFFIFVITLTLVRLVNWVKRIKEKLPNIALLLNILGAYTIIYFIINLFGMLIQYINSNGQRNTIYSIYEEWGELIIAAIDIVFFTVFITALFVILIKKLIKKAHK